MEARSSGVSILYICESPVNVRLSDDTGFAVVLISVTITLKVGLRAHPPTHSRKREIGSDPQVTADTPGARVDIIDQLHGRNAVTNGAGVAQAACGGGGGGGGGGGVGGVWLRRCVVRGGGDGVWRRCVVAAAVCGGGGGGGSGAVSAHPKPWTSVFILSETVTELTIGVRLSWSALT